MINKIRIKDASDVYPNCSRQFAVGVHTWISLGNNYDIGLIYQESEDFRRGYFQAKEDLGHNYILIR